MTKAELIAVVSEKTNPPVPARKPEIPVPRYLIFFTFTPRESAAWGFSPQARSLIPKGVL